MKLNHEANIFEYGHRPRPMFSMVSDRADIVPCKFNEITLAFKEGVEVQELAELAVDVLAFLAEQTQWGHYQTMTYTAKQMYKLFEKAESIDGTARNVTDMKALNEPN